MKGFETDIDGLIILEPKIFGDSRGYFYESYNKKALSGLDIDYNFVQDNQSKSSYGVIRGLHFQKEPHAQTKLIRVLEGSIYDVVVDLRPGSRTYGEWMGFNLSSDNNQQLLIPKGFAHGFSTLSEYATILYKCDEYYNFEFDGGIRYNDPQLNIDWKVPTDKIIVSEKDNNLPYSQNVSFDN